MNLLRRWTQKTPFPTLLFFATLALTLVPVQRGYATAADGLQLQARFDNPQAEANTKGERVLELLVTTPKHLSSQPALARIALNIALVIDTSGSMGQEGKLETVKSAAHNILDKLQPGDRFALITYNNSATVHIPLEPVESLRHAHRLIDALRPGGNTHLSAGLRHGYRQLHRHLDTSVINRIFLLSDGLANMGETNPRRLGDWVEMEQHNGISLSTFGVGLDFNETLMAELSERGRGMYYFIDEPARSKEILAQAFRATREIVAKDVELEVQLHPAAVVREVYANSYQIHGNTLTIQAGDLSVGERRRIHIRIATPVLDKGDQNIGQVRMEYQQPGQATAISQTLPMSLRYGTFGQAIEKARDWTITERTKVFEAHYARDKAAQIYDKGDVTSAKRILHKSLQNLRNAKVHGKRISKELEETSTYLNALEQQLDRKERKKSQKAVKYKKYLLEGC